MAVPVTRAETNIMHAYQKRGVLNRFGLADAALQRAREKDATLDEACADLEEIASALKNGASDRNLIRLANELEAEILLRLTVTARTE